MNQQPTGFLQYKSAEGLSPVTVRMIQTTFYQKLDQKSWMQFVQGQFLSQILNLLEKVDLYL